MSVYMDRRPFKLDKNELYIACHSPSKMANGSYSGLIGVYKLLTPQKDNMLTNMDWSFEPQVVDPDSTNGYNSLEIHGQLVDYHKLLQALCISKLRVNMLGYCYFQLGETMGTYGFTFYRMNDMWNWCNYGINNLDVTSDKFDRIMNWDRLDILYGVRLMSPFQSEHKQEIQRLKDEASKLQAELEKYKSENQRLKDELAKYKDNENQRLLEEKGNSKETDQSSLIRKPVASKLFVIKRISGRQLEASHEWKYYWEKNKFEKYLTPNNKALTDAQVAETYISLSFWIDIGVVFDTSNWYAISVEELTYPILIYQGSAFTVEVDGYKVFAPMRGTDTLDYNLDNPPQQKTFVISLTILAGSGPILALKLLR